MSTEQWLSIVEYARYFNVSDMTVRRRIKTGRLQAVLREGKYYIPIQGDQKAKIPAERAAPTMTPNPDIGKSTPKVPEPRSHYTIARETPVRPYAPIVVADTIPAAEPVKPPPNSEQDAAALLKFCDSVLARVENSEVLLKEKTAAEIGALEARTRELEERLRGKELEINALKQQNEDLNVLIKILEDKSFGQSR